jgi:hypothetical protein
MMRPWMNYSLRAAGKKWGAVDAAEKGVSFPSGQKLWRSVICILFEMLLFLLSGACVGSKTFISRRVQVATKMKHMQQS